MINQRITALAAHIENYGVAHETLVNHKTEIAEIALWSDGRLPELVTNAKQKFELKFVNPDRDRHLIFAFNNLNRGGSTISRNTTHKSRSVNPKNVREEFNWLLEGEQRTNLAKRAVEDVMSGFQPPYIATRYWHTDELGKPIGQAIEWDPRFHANQLQDLYDEISKRHPRTRLRFEIYAREHGVEIPEPIHLDTQACEKAFYTGDFKPDTVLPAPKHDHTVPTADPMDATANPIGFAATTKTKWQRLTKRLRRKK